MCHYWFFIFIRAGFGRSRSVMKFGSVLILRKSFLQRWKLACGKLTNCFGACWLYVQVFQKQGVDYSSQLFYLLSTQYFFRFYYFPLCIRIRSRIYSEMLIYIRREKQYRCKLLKGLISFDLLYIRIVYHPCFYRS